MLVHHTTNVCLPSLRHYFKGNIHWSHQHGSILAIENIYRSKRGTKKSATDWCSEERESKRPRKNDKDEKLNGDQFCSVVVVVVVVFVFSSWDFVEGGRESEWSHGAQLLLAVVLRRQRRSSTRSFPFKKVNHARTKIDLNKAIFKMPSLVVPKILLENFGLILASVRFFNISTLLAMKWQIKYQSNIRSRNQCHTNFIVA